jgi:hypothetical protein
MNGTLSYLSTAQHLLPKLTENDFAMEHKQYAVYFI